jgi:hypothetical protein
VYAVLVETEMEKRKRKKGRREGELGHYWSAKGVIK